MDSNFKYCKSCDDETLHREDECQRCINSEKIIVYVPMTILNRLVDNHKIDIDQAIDTIFEVQREELKYEYEQSKNNIS
tara:strand:- start:10241 stop:10477 length:237 start_codon:yes stop_codon:yes gene_type:complete